MNPTPLNQLWFAGTYNVDISSGTCGVILQDVWTFHLKVLMITQATKGSNPSLPYHCIHVKTLLLSWSSSPLGGSQFVALPNIATTS